MGKAPLHTRNWCAVHKTDDLTGANPHIDVKGEVETTRSNQRAKLTRAEPQGINPKILELDLALVTEGDVGNEVMGWTEATYSEPAEAGQFTHVHIRGADAQPIKVEHRPS